jgi:hypothetical protein
MLGVAYDDIVEIKVNITVSPVRPSSQLHIIAVTAALVHAARQFDFTVNEQLIRSCCGTSRGQ